MNVKAIQAEGPYCTLESYRNGGPWVPSDQTNIAATFQREIARMRGGCVARSGIIRRTGANGK